MPRKVMIWPVLALLVTACGPGTTPRPPATPAPATSTPATSAPPVSPDAPPTSPDAPPTSPGAPPTSPDARRADDIDGDGRSDLVVQVDLPREDRRYLSIVHGSPQGLDPRRRTLITSKTFDPWLIDDGIRADLDGDGFGDVLAYGRPGGGEHRMGPHIFWGGPRGIAATATPTPVPLPVAGDVGNYRAVAGDFDGDGAADVAMSSPPAPGASDTNLAVLYGPFARDGAPRRRSVQPSPTGSEFWRMSVDRIGAGHATALLVYEGDDGEQTSGWLLTPGRGGPAKQGRKLNKGMSAAFGDFDGDGSRDVAVGDDGSRNDEPGYESEAPSVDRTLTVYYGGGRTGTFKGTAGRAVSGDFDGDGRDDLAFGGGSRPILTFWGAAGGLRAGGRLAAAAGSRPLAAGDYDGDGDDELALASGADDFLIIVTDGRKTLTTLPSR
ncbi:VCBS repeat-containing protein [Nonomuraea fuscirosea]|uniref:FG-GAP repeat domain-containing protein n=1 Tax=Nonomuraea fuscirosea TaxID=1291556 RepID=UPI002DD9436D|nr:VCBS repeat-containing protein [Nonomuraea fuscirosea]WSA48715.1 VCBS repeat-containing protein [Nonomuraea fuscirosea]